MFTHQWSQEQTPVNSYVVLSPAIAEQERGCGWFRAVPADGGRQAPDRQALRQQTADAEEAWPTEALHGGGEPLLDGSWNDPR